MAYLTQTLAISKAIIFVIFVYMMRVQDLVRPAHNTLITCKTTNEKRPHTTIKLFVEVDYKIDGRQLATPCVRDSNMVVRFGEAITGPPSSPVPSFATIVCVGCTSKFR